MSVSTLPRALPTRPLSSVLVDLAPPRPTAAPTPAAIEERIEAARRESYAQGRAEAEAEAQARLEALGAQAQAERLAALAEARALWAQAEGEALARRIEAAFGALRDGLEEDVAAALRPLAAAEAARQAARMMADEIARLLAAGAADARPLEIAGPADLLAAIRAALAAGPGVDADDPRLAFVEAAGADAVARLGRLRIETRFASLADALAGEG